MDPMSTHFFESSTPIYRSRFRIGPSESPTMTNEMVRLVSELRLNNVSMSVYEKIPMRKRMTGIAALRKKIW